VKDLKERMIRGGFARLAVQAANFLLRLGSLDGARDSIPRSPVSSGRSVTPNPPQAPPRSSSCLTARSDLARLRPRVPTLSSLVPADGASVPAIRARASLAAHPCDSPEDFLSLTATKPRGDIRAQAFQTSPHEEVKLIRCTRGAIFDAIIGLRCGSPTFKQRLAVVLSADNAKTLCVPEGFAHGFQTSHDNTEVFHQMSQFYVPAMRGAFVGMILHLGLSGRRTNG